MNNSSMQNNSMQGSSRRRSTNKTEESFQKPKSPKFIGLLFVGAWLIIAPLVWNVSKVYAVTSISNQEHAMDAPAIRALKPVASKKSVGSSKRKGGALMTMKSLATAPKAKIIKDVAHNPTVSPQSTKRATKARPNIKNARMASAPPPTAPPTKAPVKAPAKAPVKSPTNSLKATPQTKAPSSLPRKQTDKVASSSTIGKSSKNKGNSKPTRNELVEVPKASTIVNNKNNISQVEVWSTFEAVIGVLEASHVDYFLMGRSLLEFSRSNDTQHPHQKAWTVTGSANMTILELAVSTAWLKRPNRVANLQKNLVSAGFVWIKSHRGIDGTAASLGGAQVYARQGVQVELVATDVTSSFHVNGFRHGPFHLGCPKPFSEIESLTWGGGKTKTPLSVRVPMPFQNVLQATYGTEYTQSVVSKQDDESSRMEDAISTGACMIVKDTNYRRPKKDIPDFQRGIVTVVSSAESTAQILVLAKKLNDTWYDPEQPLALEVHHSGELSYHLEARLTLYPFVTVVNLRTVSTFPSKKLNYTEANLNMQALHTTKLRHVLWVNASIQFLYNPMYILQTMEYIHNNDPKCQALPEGGSCVTATDPLQPELLKEALHDSEHMYITRTLPVNFIRKVFLKQTSLVVATVYEAIEGVGLWMHPTPNFGMWASSDVLELSTSLVLGKRERAPPLVQEYHNAIKYYWKLLVEARRIMLMDRSIEWVAFDGGLFWQHLSLNSKAAVHESHNLHVPVINVDITMSSDKELIATHNERFFTPYDFPGTKLPNAVSSMKGKNLKNLTNPCIPEATVRKWLYDNPYQSFHCSPEKVKPVEEFMVYSLGNEAEVQYDLKASTGEGQIIQAKALVEAFGHFDEVLVEQGKVSVRFFDVTEDKKLASAIIPEHALHALAAAKTLENLAYYVSAPSLLACSQIVSWISNHKSFRNKNILGCNVIMEHDDMKQKWESFVVKNKVPLDVLGLPKTPSKIGFPVVKAICDIPRKQISPDLNFWKTSHIACIEEGFVTIMHPWHVPMNADFYTLPSGMEEVFPKIQNRLMTTIVPSRLKGTMNTTDSTWSMYVSQWGLTHLSDWSNRRDEWFRGDAAMRKVPSEKESLVSFRCITKIIVSMLFLRLEELGLAALDDAVPIHENPANQNISWRQIITNTAMAGAIPASTSFNYDSDVWKYAPAYVQQVCGVSFITAARHYVLDPMGLVGTFDQNTTYPPYASRGFVGPLDDLLLIGSTLASAGVSPKTRKQVLTATSVEQMLRNTVPKYDPTKASFYDHTVVKSMARFTDKDSTNTSMPPGVVDGYGMGLWCVNGWRHTKQGDPIRGWLSLGSSEALLYFDVTGMVLAFHSPTRHLGYELTAAFANAVRDVGDHILQKVIPKF